MNNTKWDELRLAMYSLGDQRPRWRTRSTTNGYICPWDGEWFYHFREGGYDTIEWVEIEIRSKEQKDLVLEQLRKIHVPGEVSEHGFIVFGYTPAGRPVEYL
jgi:hypothetical protein